MRGGAARSARHAVKSLTDRVHAQLRADVLSCLLAPGTPVYEGELARQYGVSKTPVREALNSLRQEGLVEVLPRRGYQIMPLTMKDILTLLELRAVLETGAAALAAGRASKEGLDELEQLAHASYRRGDQQSETSFIEANTRFHKRVAELSGNERISALVARCLDELQRVFHLGADLRDISEEVAKDHLDLVVALRRRDPEAARGVVAAQVEHTRENIVRALTATSGSAVHLEFRAPVRGQTSSAVGQRRVQGR